MQVSFLDTSHVIVWPLVVYFLLVVTLVFGIIALSYLLGQKHSDPATGEPYESGIVSLGSAHLRLSAQFYLIALFFVIFDLESVFIIAWAISFYDLGWTGYFEMMTFIGIMIVSLIYLWRRGALEWRRI